MTQVPFFLPSSKGELAAMAHLPAADPRPEASILLLTGGRAGRRVVKSIADELASAGFMCLRFDYPGTGATPVTDPLPREELVSVTCEVGRWWSDRTGAELAIVGRCLGARLGVAAAARDNAVRRVVGIYLPVTLRTAKQRLRRGIKKLDSRGPRLASRLIQGPRVVDRTQKGDPDEATLESDLASAVDTRFRFLYGGNDSALPAFSQLLAGTPEAVRERVEVALLPDARLHGVPDLEHDAWVRSQVMEALSV